MALELDIAYLPCQAEIFFDSPAKFVIVPKGRRLGFTRGGAHAFIEFMIDGVSPLLWVDTINGNIERYFDRYFLPILKQIPKDKWSFNRQKKELRVYNSILDMRSADAPESIEGFGYKKILLNEAGIILKDTYLFSNAILPMLLDFPDSQLIAAGVPKGKYTKDGNKHKFFELYEACLEGKEGYQLRQYTSYDNPLLQKLDIDNLALSMTDEEYQQEILGEFVDFSGTNPFAHQYNPEKHESIEAVFDPNKQLLIRVDFNLNPFAVTFGHLWRDSKGEHYHVVSEDSISQGSIPAMVDLIKLKYESQLSNCIATGDGMGNRGDISQRDNASNWEQLRRGLGLKQSQLWLPANPTHDNSRADVNYVLCHFPDYKINPKTCPNLCRDMRNVQCDAFGSILKKDRKDLNQRADFIDTERYGINTFLRKWIDQHSKIKR
jgi:hypothetical protein